MVRGARMKKGNCDTLVIICVVGTFTQIRFTIMSLRTFMDSHIGARSDRFATTNYLL